MQIHADRSQRADGWLQAENRLLVVDDNDALLGLMEAVAQRLGYEVVAMTALEGRMELEARRPSLILLDVNLPAPSAPAYEIPAGVPVILMSGDTEEKLYEAAAERCAQGMMIATTLVKPFELPVLRQALLDHRRDPPV